MARRPRNQLGKRVFVTGSPQTTVLGQARRIRPDAGLEELQDVAEDFMLNSSASNQASTLITDLSRLHDFLAVDDMELREVKASCG